MKWKIVKARTTKITRATTAARHDLEHYCRDLNGWPRSWMGLEKDVPPGEQLLALFRPFLEHLAASDLSPKTIQKHTDLARISRALIGKVEALDPTQRVVLDMDSTEIPVYGEQENSAYNGHFESTCYHPLLLFNRQGDCLAAKLRPGNVHSADEWEELLLPEIARQQKVAKKWCFGRMPPSPSPRSIRRWRSAG